MLRSMKSLMGYQLEALDGELGEVVDFHFDDLTWTLRYLVADTSRWLGGRRVLLSPFALGEPDWAARLFPVRLTKEQVRDAPAEDTARTVSRAHEEDLARHYAWTTYWAFPPFPPTPPPPAASSPAQERSAEGVHLRSLDEVLGYHVRAESAAAGNVDDMIVDTGPWIVRYLVIDTRRWWPGGRVLLSPEWIERIDWAERAFYTTVSRQTLKESPTYTPSEEVNRDYEERLYDYLGRPKYWT